MIERLVKGGMDKDQAEKLAKISVDREISTIITAEEISGPFFFDIKIYQVNESKKSVGKCAITRI